MSEADRIAKVRALFGEAHAGVPVAVGDDCAVLAPPGEPLVWTIDAQVEGVHFALPAELPEADLDAILAGQLAASRALGLPIVGGNFTRAREIGITTTVLGACARPVTRAGARPGDLLLAAGPLGLARVGLEAARRGAGGPELASALAAFRRPRARLEDGLAAAEAHAMIDVSDGLALDASRLGVGVELDAAALVASDGLAEAARRVGLDPIACSLHGGDDYALLAAAPGPIRGFRAIGRVVAEAGVWLAGDGARRPITPGGWDHFG